MLEYQILYSGSLNCSRLTVIMFSVTFFVGFFFSSHKLISRVLLMLFFPVINFLFSCTETSVQIRPYQSLIHTQKRYCTRTASN